MNAFAAECHHDNQHWWHDPATGAKIERNMGEMLMLVVSEIAECMEGERKDLMDTHLKHRKMAEVELADAMIRLGDIAGAIRVSISVDGLSVFLPDNKGEALFALCRRVSCISTRACAAQLAGMFSNLIVAIETYASHHGYDLWGAIAEKRSYNATRADHKPSARLAANGKKW